ncbi:pickpocket 26 [Carabus blaptoides fortunei]
MKRTGSWAERQIPLANIDNPEKEMENNHEPDYEAKAVPARELGMCSTLKIYFREYCENSSLHGIRYMGEKGRSTTERIWWVLIFVASIFMCSHLIHKTWIKWNLSPVIVSFAQSPTPVWQVPFPAVTICSETKARQSVFNFTEAYHSRENLSELTAEQIKNFEDVSLICDTHLYTDGNKTTDQSAIDFIHDVAPQFEEMLFKCKWTNKLGTNCTELFFPTLTEEGLCYTFNMLDSPELLSEEAQNEHYLNHGEKSLWSLDGGYPKGTNMSVYPRRALGAGIKAGLTILMRAYEYDLDYICRGPVQGFKILLHNPAETPRVSQQYFRAPLNQEVIVAVQPDMMTTSDGLKDYHPSRRHCYFPNEKQLRFYKVYTQQNCEVECLTNFTLNRCGCVAYHMPRAQNTPICGSGSTKCVATAQVDLLQQEVQSEINEENLEFTGEISNSPQKCNCLPACTSLTYNAETSQADFNWPKLFQAFKADLNEMPGIQMTRVNIFFKGTQFITSRRSELYGQTDFLANCGGLLGLFMGFSFLSLIEIVYFLTLRMWCNIKMHGRRMWSSTKIDHLRASKEKH